MSEMQCPKCGRTLTVESGAAFCPYCGGSLQAPEVKPENAAVQALSASDEIPLTSSKSHCNIRPLHPARVAELVDALASGASGGNSVEVRVLSWAP